MLIVFNGQFVSAQTDIDFNTIDKKIADGLSENNFKKVDSLLVIQSQLFNNGTSLHGKHILSKIKYFEREGSFKDSILVNCMQGLEIFETEKMHKEICALQNSLIKYYKLYETSGPIDSLIELYSENADLSKEGKLIYNAQVLRAERAAFKYEFDTALTELYAAEKKWLSLSKEQQLEANPYGTLGYIYFKMGDYEKCIEPNEKLIKFSIENERFRSACQVSNNLAAMYIFAKKDTAKYLSTLWKSIEFGEQSNFKYGVANACSQLTTYYMSTNQLDSVEYYFDRLDEAVPVIEEVDFKALVSRSKGMFYAAKKDFKTAKRYYQEAYDIWEANGDARMHKKSADDLVKIAVELKDYANAYKYKTISYNLRDTLVNEAKLRKANDVELQEQSYKDSIVSLEIQQKNELEYQQNIAQEKQANFLLWFGLGFLAIIVIWIIYAYRKKRKQALILDEKNKIIEESLSEKQLLLKEIHHRVKNNFQIVSSLLELQSKGIEDDTAKKLALEGQNRVKSMALIHQKLYQNDDLTVNFLEYLEQLVKEMTNMFATQEIATNVEADDQVYFDIDTLIPLGLILNELLTNSFKYGLNGTEENSLMVKLDRVSDEFYELTVKDSGAGMSDDIPFEKRKSLGLRLIKRLSKQLHGNVTYIYDQGAQFTVKFKDQDMRMNVE